MVKKEITEGSVFDVAIRSTALAEVFANDQLDVLTRIGDHVNRFKLASLPRKKGLDHLSGPIDATLNAVDKATGIFGDESTRMSAWRGYLNGIEMSTVSIVAGVGLLENVLSCLYDKSGAGMARRSSVVETYMQAYRDGTGDYADIMVPWHFSRTEDPLSLVRQAFSPYAEAMTLCADVPLLEAASVSLRGSRDAALSQARGAIKRIKPRRAVEAQKKYNRGLDVVQETRAASADWVLRSQSQLLDISGNSYDPEKRGDFLKGAKKDLGDLTKRRKKAMADMDKSFPVILEQVRLPTIAATLNLAAEGIHFTGENVLQLGAAIDNLVILTLTGTLVQLTKVTKAIVMASSHEMVNMVCRPGGDRYILDFYRG